MNAEYRLQGFLDLSATLTGFSQFRLRGTGQAAAYLTTVDDAAGEPVLDALLARWADVQTDAGDDEDALHRALRAHVLSDDLLGPVARNVIKLWFVGTWYQLPQDWRDTHGTGQPDTTHVVSPAAYTEGLLWPTIDANPPGAKGPGYGTWAAPPRIPQA